MSTMFVLTVVGFVVVLFINAGAPLLTVLRRIVEETDATGFCCGPSECVHEMEGKM